MSRHKRQRASAPPTAVPARTDDRRRLTLAALAIGVLALVVYSNSFGAGLTYDNRAIIEGDPRVHSWSPDTLSLIFTRGYWWPEGTSDLYRPLTTLTYWANYTLLGAGTDVTGYHVVNLALHVVNAVLVLVIVHRLSSRVELAAIAAALFAVHPINTEAVTNIIGRADLLATLSVLLGGWCYVRAAAPDATRKAVWLAAVGVIAVLGVFTKETAVMIGAFMFLYDALWRWPLVRGDSWGARVAAAWREFGSGYLALVPAVVAFVATRVVLAQHSTLIGPVFGNNPIAGATWFSGFMTAWKVFGRYLVVLVFPRTLSSDYSYNQIPLYLESPDPWQNAQPWIVLAVVVALLWLAWRMRTRHAIASWGTLFLLLMPLPTSNLVVRIGSIMADRFFYLPGVGFCVVAAWLILRLGSGIRIWGVASALVLAYGVRAHVRNNDWHDEMSLWRSAMAASPESYWAHKAYAGALLMRDQDERTLDDAIVAAERGLAIVEDPPLPIERRDPAMFTDLGVYYRLKGQRLNSRGDGANALVFMRKSLAMLSRAQEVDAWRNNAWREQQLRKGRAPDEIPNVGSAAVYHELGDTYLEVQDWAAAQEAARYAQQLMPAFARGYLIEGVATFYARHPDSAAVILAEALLLEPGRTDIWNNLESCYAAMNQRAPVTQTGGQYRFDTTVPAGLELVTAAARMLVGRFDVAGRAGDGRKLEARLMREYNLPGSTFGRGPTRQ